MGYVTYCLGCMICMNGSIPPFVPLWVRGFYLRSRALLSNGTFSLIGRVPPDSADFIECSKEEHDVCVGWDRLESDADRNPSAELVHFNIEGATDMQDEAFPFHSSCAFLIEKELKCRGVTLHQLYDFLCKRRIGRNLQPLLVEKPPASSKHMGPYPFQNMQRCWWIFPDEVSNLYCHLKFTPLRNVWFASRIDCLEEPRSILQETVESESINAPVKIDHRQVNSVFLFKQIHFEKVDTRNLRKHAWKYDFKPEDAHLVLEAIWYGRYDSEPFPTLQEIEVAFKTSIQDPTPTELTLANVILPCITHQLRHLLSIKDLLRLFSASKFWRLQGEHYWKSQCHAKGVASVPRPAAINALFLRKDISWKRANFCDETKSYRRITEFVRWIADMVDHDAGRRRKTYFDIESARSLFAFHLRTLVPAGNSYWKAELEMAMLMAEPSPVQPQTQSPATTTSRKPYDSHLLEAFGVIDLSKILNSDQRMIFGQWAQDFLQLEHEMTVQQCEQFWAVADEPVHIKFRQILWAEKRLLQDYKWPRKSIDWFLNQVFLLDVTKF